MIANELEPEKLRAFIDHFPQARAGRTVGDGELEVNYASLAESLQHSGFDHIAADLNEPLIPFRARTAARVANGNLRGTRLLMPLHYPGAAGRDTKLRMIEYLRNPDSSQPDCCNAAAA